MYLAEIVAVFEGNIYSSRYICNRPKVMKLGRQLAKEYILADLQDSHR